LFLLLLLLLLQLLLTHCSQITTSTNSEFLCLFASVFFFLLFSHCFFVFYFFPLSSYFVAVSTGSGGGGGAGKGTPSTPTLEGDTQHQRDANAMSSPASSVASSPGGQVVVADTPEAAEARLLRNAELHRDALIKGKYCYAFLWLCIALLRCSRITQLFLTPRAT
jgi:hypothetical protein